AMNQLLEESYVRPGSPRGAAGVVPALDLSETEDAFHIEMAVPGLKHEDLEITFENNILTIKGELRKEEESTKRNYHRVERRFGVFQRSLTLPSRINPEAINAALNNGVLRVDIPKAEEVKPRRISVAVEA
ncbi:MAG TPA: Hsp20/alpha crystallin family protein, partial [Roseiflexaceae bacterium]|nr:Hsp20/alpha crystallin family protein [Roseiflexaceae bacterium]